MANPDHLKKLLEGREAWNAWRAEENPREPDLSEAVLDGMDLSGFDLDFVILSGASLVRSLLRDVSINDANFDDAVWTHAKLSYVRFDGISAVDCCFDDTRVFRTTFEFCNLSRASFRNTSFVTASFQTCRLRETDFSRAYIDATFSNTDLRNVGGFDNIDAMSHISVGIDTFFRSGGLPEHFLRVASVPEEFITYAASLTGEPIEYYSCFISYSSKDDEFTRRLHADLQARKIRTWFAPEDLKIGDRFHSRIDESIRVHDKLVLILSKHSIDSPWVRREVDAAREREDRERRDVLFPIRLDDAIFESNEPWAAELRRSRHIGDFRNWKSHDDYSLALERLVRDLKKEGPIVMS